MRPKTTIENPNHMSWSSWRALHGVTWSAEILSPVESILWNFKMPVQCQVWQKDKVSKMAQQIVLTYMST